MDPGGLGALLGVGILGAVGLTAYLYDRCVHYRSTPPVSNVTNPLLVRRSSFKVKNLFNHVQF